MSGFNSIRIKHPEIDQLIPIEFWPLKNKNGYYTCDVEFTDKSYLDLLDYPNEQSNDIHNEYEKKIRDILEPFTKLKWDDPSIPREVKDEKSILNYILFNLIPKYEYSRHNHAIRKDFYVSCEGEEYDIYNDEVLTCLLTNKDFILVAEQNTIYLNKNIKEYTELEIEIYVSLSKGHYTIKDKVYFMGGSDEWRRGGSDEWRRGGSDEGSRSGMYYINTIKDMIVHSIHLLPDGKFTFLNSIQSKNVKKLVNENDVIDINYFSDEKDIWNSSVDLANYKNHIKSILDERELVETNYKHTRSFISCFSSTEEYTSL